MAGMKLAVYSIIEKEGSDKNYWHRIGVAFVNKDRSLNVLLNSLPLDGKLHIRKEEPRESGGGNARQYPDAQPGTGNGQTGAGGAPPDDNSYPF